MSNNLNVIVEKIKVMIWRMIKSPSIHMNYNKTLDERVELNILNSEQTVEYINTHLCSVARFGDGEFQMIQHYLSGNGADSFNVDSFQGYNPELGKRLLDVLRSNCPGLLLCVPYPLIDSSVYKGYDRVFFEREWLGRKSFLKPLLSGRLIGDTTFTRFYLHRTDIADYKRYITALKDIWNKKNIVIVEGEFSRLGVGNDLFSNASSIQRVICPATNAFNCYSKILESVCKFANDKLVLLALGQTATVLVYDLEKAGFRALDLGHIDVEYEWWRMKVTDKVAIPGKYVNEVREGRINSDCLDDVYRSQIVAVIHS